MVLESINTQIEGPTALYRAVVVEPTQCISQREHVRRASFELSVVLTCQSRTAKRRHVLVTVAFPEVMRRIRIRRCVKLPVAFVKLPGVLRIACDLGNAKELARLCPDM